MSQSANRAKLGRWLHPLVFAPGPEGAPVKTELRHLGSSDRATVVRAWSLTDPDEGRIKDVCDQVEQSAQDDAEGVGGVQKYAAVALDAEGKPVGRLIMRCRGEALEESGGDSFDSEPANGKGLVSQAMRHAEAYAKTLAAGLGGTIEQLARQNAMLATQVSKMMDERAEFVATMEEMASAKHVRDMEAKQLEASNHQKEIIAGEVAALMPALVQKFTGVTPAGLLPPEVAALRNLAGGLTDSQIESVMGALSPAQQAALATILADAATGEVRDREAKDERARKNGGA